MPHQKSPRSKSFVSGSKSFGVRSKSFGFPLRRKTPEGGSFPKSRSEKPLSAKQTTAPQEQHPPVAIGPAGRPTNGALSPNSTSPSYIYPYRVELDMLTLEASRNMHAHRSPSDHTANFLVPVFNSRDKSVAFNVQSTHGCALHDASGNRLYRMCHKRGRTWPRYIIDSWTNSIMFNIRCKQRKVAVYYGEKGKKTPWMVVMPMLTQNCLRFVFMQPGSDKMIASLTKYVDSRSGTVYSMVLRVQPNIDVSLVLAVALTILGERYPIGRNVAAPNPAFAALAKGTAGMLPVPAAVF